MKGKGTREEIQQYGTIGQSKGFIMLGYKSLIQQYLEEEQLVVVVGKFNICKLNMGLW